MLNRFGQKIYAKCGCKKIGMNYFFCGKVCKKLPCECVNTSLLLPHVNTGVFYEAK